MPLNRTLRLMPKFLLVPVLFALACLFAGLYGALHDQVSYTVSSEYFTRFKFHQFGMPDTISNRLGAALVGWQASWWMGVVIGVVLIPPGLVIRGARQYFVTMIRTFGIVALTTLAVGLIALLVAFMTVNEGNAGEFTTYGNKIVNDVAFARAGTMHNFSYLGGLIGIVTGAGAIYYERRRQKHATSPCS